MAQGALGWNLARSSITIPIPGFKTVDQARDNAGALAHGPLTTSQMRDIDTVLKRGSFSTSAVRGCRVGRLPSTDFPFHSYQPGQQERDGRCVRSATGPNPLCTSELALHLQPARATIHSA